MADYLIGIDLGGTNLKLSLFDFELNPVFELRAPTEARYGAEHVLRRMADAVRLLLHKSGVAAADVRCVGVGVPGLLDKDRGVSRFSPNFPDWQEVPVAEWLSSRLCLPVVIDNDVRMHLYGEWNSGAGRGKKNIVLLTLGTGLGAGVVVDGHVLYGATNSAGEVGHLNIVPHGGRECRCGSTGCLGRYVSALGLLRTVREKLAAGQTSVLTEWSQGDLQKITAKMVSDAFDLNDEVAVQAMRETGETLGLGLVGMINLYNPEVLIIGGGMSGAGERLLAPARRVVTERALAISREVCEITVAELGDSAGMLGAAVYARARALRFAGAEA